jgi:hypothetical protein
MVTRPAFRWSAAGILAGPGAWAVNTQANYALASWLCAGHLPILFLLGITLAVLAAAGGLVSFLSLNRHAESPEPTLGTAGEPRRVLAGVGAFSGMLFALIILTQTAAGLFLSGCER